MKKNRLKYFKKYSVQFDFISLKQKNFNRIELVQLKINRIEPKLKPIRKSKKNPKNNITFNFNIK